MQNLTEQERTDLILSVGTHQCTRRLSPLEVSKLIDRLLSSGMTRKECADTLGLGVTAIRVFLSLLDLTGEVQHLADWRGSGNATIPFSSLAELSRLSRSDQGRAAQAILKYGLTWKEVVQLIQIAGRSSKEIDHCVEEVIRLRPTITVHHLFVGAITRATLSENLTVMPQAHRDYLLSETLRRILGPDFNVKSRLGVRDFTILAEQNLGTLLQIEPDKFEELVNASVDDLRTEIALSD